MTELPPHVRAEVRRILDAEARRILVEQLDAAAAADNDEPEQPDEPDAP